MLLSSCPPENHGGDSSDGSQSLLHQDKKAQSTLFAQRALQERRLKPPDQIIACPRCQSLNTKFCYYNNYSLTQPRHFCKNCRRYWTAGGTLRNVPIGGGCRKNKRKQRTTDLSSALTVDSSVSALRNDNAGAALHPYNLAMASASTSNGYYDHPYDENSVKQLARAQLSVRAGPSGVSQSAEGSGLSSNGHVSAFSSTHGSHSSQSNFDHPTQLLTLGGYSGMTYPQVKQDIAGLPTGDLSAMFDPSQSYRSVVAAAAASGGSSLGEGVPYNIDIESLNTIEASDMQWRMQHAQAQAAQKQQAMWAEEEQEHREARQVIHHADEKGLMESLRKGKSAMTVSPSSGHDQSEGQEAARPSTIWQPVPENLQSFEQVSHESSAFWTNGNTWAPLDMHSLNPTAIRCYEAKPSSPCREY